MWRRPHLWATVIGLTLAGASSGGPASAQASRPVAVSPGEPAKASLSAPCPTFDWGPTEGAIAYELVVYRLGSDLDEQRPILRREIGGSALGWTPALDQCFESGHRYAWSIRGVLREGLSEWADPMLFEVGAVAPMPEVAVSSDAQGQHGAEPGSPRWVEAEPQVLVRASRNLSADRTMATDPGSSGSRRPSGSARGLGFRSTAR